MWQKGYSIFCFAYGGTVYNASGVAIDEEINNFFETESEAWQTLQSLNGLNERLVFTVFPAMEFVK
jgi:hypothetical protein